MTKTHKTIIIILTVIIVAALSYWAYDSKLTSDTDIAPEENNNSEKSIYEEVVVDELVTFKECIGAGNPVSESYPRQCQSSDGRTFIEEFCVKESTQDVLTLADAKKIAIDSECGNRFKEFSICNQDTGTWWIDLDIEKEGCSPACVINVETKTAEINWRCTEAID